MLPNGLGWGTPLSIPLSYPLDKGVSISAPPRFLASPTIVWSSSRLGACLLTTYLQLLFLFLSRHHLWFTDL